MKARTNGIDTNYTIDGNGEWLVFSHSLACNVTMWEPQVKAFAKRYKVMCYDTRGHGQSSAPAGAYTLDQLADDAKALLDSVGIKSCHWVGLSMGGMIGQTFQLKYPGVFKTMTLADTTSRYPAELQPTGRARIDTATKQGMEPIVQPTLERWFTEPYRKSGAPVVGSIAQAIRATPVAGLRRLLPRHPEDQRKLAPEGSENTLARHRRRAGSRHAGIDGEGDPRESARLGARHPPLGGAPVESRAARRIQPGALALPGAQRVRSDVTLTENVMLTSHARSRHSALMFRSLITRRHLSCSLFR